MMTKEEEQLSESFYRHLPDLDPEAQITVNFTAGYRGGIVVQIDGGAPMTVPWDDIAEAVAARLSPVGQAVFVHYSLGSCYSVAKTVAFWLPERFGQLQKH